MLLDMNVACISKYVTLVFLRLKFKLVILEHLQVD